MSSYIQLTTRQQKSVVQPLIEHIGRYGIPRYLQSDKGTQFVIDVIEELTKS